MSSPLTVSFGQQLEALRQAIRSEWVWPSPGAGFAYYAFDAAGESPPPDMVVAAEIPLHRMNQAPILAAYGYIFATKPQQLPEGNLPAAWAEGLERLAVRNAFPADRESFVYRPVELLGVALGAACCPGVPETTRAWLHGVMDEAEGTMSGEGNWQIALGMCAAHALGRPWRAARLLEPKGLAVPDLALLYWVTVAFPDVAQAQQLSAAALEAELVRQCALHAVTETDIARAAAVYFSLHRAVQRMLTMNPTQESYQGMTAIENGSPRVFISYSHDNDEAHRERVLRLSNRLRDEGIDCHVDRYYETPPPAEGWARWMERQIEQADFILTVCTENYYHCFRGDPECRGKGAVWEGAIITQGLYDAYAKNTKFVPIGFRPYGVSKPFIPLPLRPTNYYDASDYGDYERLYRHLTGQPEIHRPPLGTRRSLPPRK